MNVSRNDPLAQPSSWPFWKQTLAFCLGLLSLALAYFLNERFGGLAALFGVGSFCLIAQFLLARGNPHAFLDLASVVILNAPLACVFFVSGGLGLMILSVVAVLCSYAGAVLAAIMAARLR